VTLNSVQNAYPIATTGPLAPPEPTVPENVYTTWLGITDRQVQEEIEAGTADAFSAVGYAAKVALYNGWNFFTAGFVGRQAERYQATVDGELTDSNYMTASLIDGVTSIAAIAVTGRAASALGGASGGVWTEAAVGAKIGAQFTIIQKGGELGTYTATDYLPGQTGLSVDYARETIIELATSTVAGAGLGFVGPILSRIPRANYKIVWNSPTTNNSLPFRLVEPTIPTKGLKLLGTEADTTGGSILKNAGGTLRAGSIEIHIPESQSMTVADATDWLVQQAAKIPQMLNKIASLREQAIQAVTLKNALVTASRNAMQNTSAAAQLNLTKPIRSFNEMVQARMDEYAGNALYKKVISDAVEEATSLRPVTNPIGCFVAGTLIHTKEGLVPIEKIKVGEWVLSQPQQFPLSILKVYLSGCFLLHREIPTVWYKSHSPRC
jgi:hypothetical protein